MANEKVVLRRGPSSSKPSAKVPGTILIETDTGNAFVDDTESSRIQIKDGTKLPIDGTAKKAEFDSNGNSLTDRITTLDTNESTGIVTLKNEKGETKGTVVNSSYVDSKVAELVGSAPETLNTLNELAAALGDDPNFATTIATQIGNKVDKEDGKGLSTNDYTDNEQAKLANIEDGANKTIVDSELSSTSENPIQNKVINTALGNKQSTPLTGTTSSVTPSQEYNAVYTDARDVVITCIDSTFGGVLIFTSFEIYASTNIIFSSTVRAVDSNLTLYLLVGNMGSNTWTTSSHTLATSGDIPTELKNPNALTFTGAVTGTYDGSSAVTIDVPTIQGEKGNDGVGIKSVKQTTTSTEDGGTNIVTVTLTNGTSTTFNVKNGSKGSTGANGAKGADGYTPIKGTDYWTNEDKTEIVNTVLAALPDGSNISY